MRLSYYDVKCRVVYFGAKLASELLTQMVCDREDFFQRRKIHWMWWSPALSSRTSWVSATTISPRCYRETCRPRRRCDYHVMREYIVNPFATAGKQLADLIGRFDLPALFGDLK